MSGNFVKRGALMLCLLAGLSVLLIRKNAGAHSVSTSAPVQAGHESVAASQTRGSGRAVYVGRHPFSPVYEYCYVDADGRPVLIHRQRRVFLLPESRPDVNERTSMETDTCQ